MGGVQVVAGRRVWRSSMVAAMHALITGSSGFVGKWLAAHLREMGDEPVALGAGVDVGDAPAVRSAVNDARPDVIYHLAGFSSVGGSWDDPGEVFRVNALGTLRVLEAAASCKPTPAVLVVSSSEVYGTVAENDLPISEDSPLRPVTPYAASKVAAEFLGLQAFLGRGVPVMIVRAFNHVGPGQSRGFVVSALASRVIEAQVAHTKVIRVGNLSARRDFTDVRDVVRAYRMLMTGGVPGEVYNVCSGRDVAISSILRRLCEIAGIDLEVEVDPQLARPVDIPVLRGDGSRLASATGWVPEISLDDTLSAVLGDWREKLGA